uniref:Sesquipedalian n=1 Tax=Sparus aurata TaxID=8175 RepID=A0A671YN80_SPAAU
MKLDEKVVSHYESSDSPVDKEGYLYKKIKTSYQKRWCMLKGNLLFYKERPTDRDLTGVIVLEGCTVQLCESEEQFAFSLVWSEPGLRTYKFAAEDQDSQESWIKALLSANHSYLALLVMDLEKKYRELEKLSKECAGITGQSITCSSCLSGQTSTLSSFPAQGAGAGPMLQALTVSSKTASKRSPKLWPKRSANVVPVNTPAPPLGEWSGVCFSSQEDFSKLHDDFGKEVKELIADWSRRGRGDDVVQEENLIDFG